MKKMGSAAIASILMMGVAVAEESTGPWSGEAELGIVATSGNTETQSISAKAKGQHESGMWLHKLVFEALNTESNEQTTAERYNLSGQSNYKFSDRGYFFGILSYEDDRFSGYDYRMSEALGYGYRVIEQEGLTLNIEGGPGARQSKLDSGKSENEAMFRAAGNLAWDISETSHFTQELTSEIGEDITVSRSVTALKTQVSGSLAMKVSFTVKRTSKVPADIEKSDRETAVTLVYGF